MYACHMGQHSTCTRYTYEIRNVHEYTGIFYRSSMELGAVQSKASIPSSDCGHNMIRIHFVLLAILSLQSFMGFLC